MSTPRRLTPKTTVALLALTLFFALLLWQISAQFIPVSLGQSGAQPPLPPTTFPPFTNVPEIPTATAPAFPPPASNSQFSAISPGTPGRTLTPPPYRSGITFAILGDRTGGTDAGQKYLATAVEELNSIRPDLVLTVGDFVQGYTRSAETYAHDAAAFRATIDHLAMPWYPCAGNHDVTPGTRDPKDRRFEQLYQKYFGPLYYSLDYAGLHFIVLYSDEQLQSDPIISEAQIAWLKNDLNKSFEAHHTDPTRAAHVFVIIHKPAWHYEKSSWNKVHELLVEFNRRPIVTVEGPAAVALSAAPHVDAVFAGHVHAFTQDPAKDGIAYYILGPTGGQIDQDASTGEMQHYTLVKVDAAGPHIALVQPGSVHADDFITARDRAIAEQISQIGNDTIGIQGILEQPVGRDVGSKDQNSHLLTLTLRNPLDVPLDIAIRLASTKFLTDATARDAANTYTDNFDSPWELYSPYVAQHLEPHQSLLYSCAMFCRAQPSEVAPPQIEFNVSFTDAKGRSVPTLLKRRLPLITSARVTVHDKSPAETDWADASVGNTFAWTPSAYDPPLPSPEFDLYADGANFYVRVRADARRFSYYPNFTKPDDLPCDAVTVAFAPSESATAAQVQRLAIVPFAPEHPLLLTNNGVGKAQTALLPLDAKSFAVTAVVTKEKDAYELTLTIPRKLIFGSGDSAVMNLTVFDNPDSAHSSLRSWAREDLGPKAWARVKLVTPPPATTTAPTTKPD